MNKDKNFGRPNGIALEKVRRACEAADAEGRLPRILFVCLGNICRSPAAQGITEAMAAEAGVGLECDSAGFYGGHAGDLPDARMRQAAYGKGYRLDHRSRKIHGIDLEDFDLVIGMDDMNMDDLYRLAATPEQEAKLARMTDFARRHPDADCVPDPYYEGPAGFILVIDLLEDACSTLVDLFRQP